MRVGSASTAAGPDGTRFEDFDAGRQRGAKQLDRLFDDGRHFHRRVAGPFLAAELKDLLNDVPGPVSAFQDALQVNPHPARAVGQLALGQLRVPQDSGQNVVEVMGDPPGKGSNGFHFLGLAELFFQIRLFVYHATRDQHQRLHDPESGE
jgi:hypothetical protein